MPEVNEKEQAPPAQEAVTPVVAPKSGSDMTQLVTKVAIIAAVGLVAVLAAFMVTSKVLKPMMAHDPVPVQQEPEPAAQESHSSGGHGGEESGDLLFNVDQIIVNPASTVGSRFLSCSVAFELASVEEQGAFESREIQIRDALITILSARTVDELSDPRLREALRRQILARVNKITEPSEAMAVYFKDFVLQ